MDENKMDINQQVLDLLVAFLENESLRLESYDTSIFDLGLDSLTLFNFLLEVEEKFDIKFSEEDFILTKMSSIRAIADTVRQTGGTKCTS